jgi:hypothetical protein
LSAQNENPFLDWPNGDFRLTKTTSAGLPLASPYNIDMLGIIRGADGVWDRGAFEFGAIRLSPPFNARLLSN